MESQFENIPQQVGICDIHNKYISKMCTQDQQFLCSACEPDHREHVVKSLAFVAEEVSESLRVKLLPNEKILEQYSVLIKEIDSKFKRSNLRTVLNQIVEIIKLIVRGLDKSQVIDDCVILQESFRLKIDKINQAKKKISMGNKQTMEVLKSKKDIDDTLQNINKEKQLIEITMEELRKINQTDFNLSIGDQQQQDFLRQKLMYSLIEMIREKSESLASLLIPQGMEQFIQEQAKLIMQNQSQQKSESFNMNVFSPKKQGSQSFMIDQNLSSINQSSYQSQIAQFSIIQEKLQQAHQDFINSIADINTDFFATAGSDYKLNLWSKSTFSLRESFELPGEVVTVARAPNDILICGMINGAIALVDLNKMQIVRVLDRAHTGTVIACVVLQQSNGQYVVTQDDSREIKVWNINDFSIPIIKTIGRSYNPVWYIQSLIEVQNSGKSLEILSGCGSENKVIRYRIDISQKQLVPVQSSITKSSPTAILQLNNQYFAVSSQSEIELFDIESGFCINTINTDNQQSQYSMESILNIAVLQVPNDPNKRYLAATGTNKTIYIFKVDLLQKCASMPVFQLETSHFSTISGLLYFVTSDFLYHYLITVSIDKQLGVYRLQLPELSQQRQEKNINGKSLVKMESNSKMSLKNMPTGVPGATGIAVQQQQQQDDNFKFLNNYLKNNESNNSGNKNAACGCILF